MAGSETADFPVPICPVCGGRRAVALGPPVYTEPTEVAHVAIDLSNLRQLVWRCRDCGYWFVDPCVPAERLLDCYARAGTNSWKTGVRAGRGRRFVHKKRLLEVWAPGRSVLDFGCYTGDFLDFIGDGYTRYGIEPSTRAASVAESRGVRTLGATSACLDDLPPLDLAVVLALDVLEHLPHPVQDIKRIARHLMPGGVVVAETGNTDTSYLRVFGRHYYYCAMPEHVGFYGRRSIEALGRAAGLWLVHFERSYHEAMTIRRNAHHLRKVVRYSLAWLAAKAGLPLTRKLKTIARGPVPYIPSPWDHFIAVLRKPRP